MKRNLLLLSLIFLTISCRRDDGFSTPTPTSTPIPTVTTTPTTQPKVRKIDESPLLYGLAAIPVILFLLKKRK